MEITECLHEYFHSYEYVTLNLYYNFYILSIVLNAKSLFFVLRMV